MAAPLPQDESARLRVLRQIGILDTGSETFSDSVAVAAAAIANTPMGAVSLVDSGRQWLKGSCGLGHGSSARDTSFCAHALLQPTPTLIADTLLDERFRSNPSVTHAPFIRFYAGFPLIVKGRALGALCVVDDRPRHLDPAQIAMLGRLAAGTSAWLAQYRPKT